MFHDQLYLKNILSNHLKKFVESEKSTPESMTYYAEYLFRECNNIFAAHGYLSKAENELNSSHLKFKQFILKKIIKHEVNPNAVGNKK